MATAFRVGTASWTDPTLVRTGLFYPSLKMTAAERLAFYATHFPTVEVDSTYYALPAERNAALWAARTPPGFVFHIKAFSWLTQHPAEATRLPKLIKEMLPAALRSAKRIKNPPPELLKQAFEMFWSAIGPLRKAGKLGYLLFQFPAYVTFRSSNFDYLASLPARMPGAEIAVEFRHRSWLGTTAREQTIGFLRDHRMALVAIDAPAEAGLPTILEPTTDEVYLRMHGRNGANWFKHNIGPAERFKYMYAERELGDWATRLGQLDDKVGRAYVIFNNCYSNFGVMNAATMQSLLRGVETHQ